jgi:hypothetical protein
LLAEIFGRPSYANYHIQLADGRLVQVASKELFEVDTCVAAKLPALSAERGYAELGQASLEPALACAPLKPKEAAPPVKDFEIPPKSGRPN